MQEIIAKLTAKDDKYACAIADKIISESHDTDEWYEYFDSFASLLNHPKSLVRNRALNILAANTQWDDENRFDTILDDYLTHITDEKPITARQCIKDPINDLLDFYMGKNTPDRKDFIVSNLRVEEDIIENLKMLS